jgi:hypothetical protein
LLATKRSLVPGAPILPTHYLLYVIPFIVIAPLSILGYGMIGRMKGEHYATPLFWLAAILGLEAYAIFGNVEPGLGLTLAYRGLNFLILPFAILTALAIHRIYKHGKLKVQGNIMVATAIALAILCLNVYAIYASINLQERYLGYFWLYRKPEYQAASWVKAKAGDMTVAGDVKTLYLLKYYFDVNVDAFQGLKYLTGSAQKPQILFVYEQMLKNGYVVYGGYSVDLPKNWTEKASILNLAYSNGLANIYAG